MTGGAPLCLRQALSPAQWMNGFAFCPGAPQGLFPMYGASYAIGALPVNAYVQPPSGARGNFLPAGAGTQCAPVSLLGTATPFGGAWSVDVESGSAAEPPQDWFDMPGYC